MDLRIYFKALEFGVRVGFGFLLESDYMVGFLDQEFGTRVRDLGFTIMGQV